MFPKQSIRRFNRLQPGSSATANGVVSGSRNKCVDNAVVAAMRIFIVSVGRVVVEPLAVTQIPEFVYGVARKIQHDTPLTAVRLPHGM